MIATTWFTTKTFWVGAVWGACAMGVGLWHWIIKPMGELLKFDRRGKSDEQADV